MSRILLVRLDGIGDALVCVPLIAALESAGHAVGIALSDRNAAIFAAGRFLATHVLERIPWPQHGSTPASRARADAEIASMQYDIALIASEEPEAYLLAAPIARRVGFTTGWQKPLKSMWIRRHLTQAIRRAATAGATRAHEADILYRLGNDVVNEAAPRELERLRPIVLDDPSLPVRSGVTVAVGPKWTTFGVTAPALNALTAALAETGARFIATAPERAAMQALLPSIAIDVPASIAAWKSVIDASRALVTIDSGGAHLAGMLGVPTVDVFPDAYYAQQSARWRPWAAPARTLRASDVQRDPSAVLEALGNL